MDSRPQKIAITGANSYIGHHLVAAAMKKGIAVHLLGRHKPGSLPSGARFFHFDLEEGCAQEALDSVDVLIHLAWYRPHASRRETKKDLNYQATKKLLALARSCGVAKVIFLSSQLASPKAFSFYARDKFAVEKLLDQPGDVIVRTGFVFGGQPIGFYAQTLKTLEKAKVMPLVRKQAPLNPIHIDDLIAILFKIMADPVWEKSVCYSVGSESPVALGDFFQILARNHFDKTVQTVSLPGFLLFGLFWILSFLHPKANDASERLGGILSARPMTTKPSLEALGVPLTQTKAWIQKTDRKSLEREASLFSRSLFKNQSDILNQNYAEAIQSHPHAKPLPLSWWMACLPKMVFWIEPLPFFKRKKWISDFRQRMLLLIQLKEQDERI